jgi:hypothetical protein
MVVIQDSVMVFASMEGLVEDTSTTIEKVKERFSRPASVLEFSPAEGAASDPLCSWLGMVTVALPGEKWPVVDGSPMMPIAQLNLKDAPFVPNLLSDVALLTLFFAEPALIQEGPNGGLWELRAYDTIDGLRPFAKDESPTLATWSRRAIWTPMPVRYRLLEKDYPSIMNLLAEEDVPEELLDRWGEVAPTCEESKVGGWPSLLQGELGWNDSTDDAEYAFQVSGFDNPAAPFRDMIYYVGRRSETRGASQWALTSYDV